MDTATASAIEATRAHRGNCWLCGDLVHRTPSGDGWAWADETGSTAGTDTDLRSLLQHYATPWGRLSELARQMEAASKAKRAELTWVYWAAAREYSALKVRLDLGLSFHQHQVRAGTERGVRVPTGPLPRHCAWPMRLTPSGWACRQCTHRQDYIST